ncbi:AbiTii domain-containing protein [Pseudomonas guariconensis]|uniref:AbiTii domain-containing protein n=1 Tax=Pseudomonas guariconensis TaxID=1288410 RepID=UPI003906BC3B
MDSLVLELQRDVLDRTIHIPDLLRKALLVSRKLKIKDIEEWLDDELNGYELRSVPSYRLISGELKAFNPYRGWIPVDMGGELHASMCETPARDSVSQIADLVERTETGTVIVKFPANLNTAFRNLMRTDYEPALHVPVHKLVRILDVTKTKIMDFALDLEARGILGEGIRFSKAEEQLAQSITYNTINIERMENSQLQQSTHESGQRKR